VRVVREYTAQYADPITVRAGDRVVVGTDDPEFLAEDVMLRDYTAVR
jgi:hypothetical protein